VALDRLGRGDTRDPKVADGRDNEEEAGEETHVDFEVEIGPRRSICWRSWKGRRKGAARRGELGSLYI
jgi:hypothetical protein